MMGATRGSYHAEYPIGSTVVVAGRPRLEAFLRDWKLHHPLDPAQLAFASAEAKVRNVSYYHGGDELYELDGVPGIWHEACLGPVRDGSAPTSSVD